MPRENGRGETETYFLVSMIFCAFLIVHIYNSKLLQLKSLFCNFSLLDRSFIVFIHIHIGYIRWKLRPIQTNLLCLQIYTTSLSDHFDPVFFNTTNLLAKIGILYCNLDKYIQNWNYDWVPNQYISCLYQAKYIFAFRLRGFYFSIS